jgi:hypothetical protein
MGPTWMPFWGSFWGLFMICMTVGWVVTTWIRAKHGYPVEDSLGGHVHASGMGSKNFIGKLEAELAKRDETIRKLEERVRVLERIVTDRSTTINEEIDRLRV